MSDIINNGLIKDYDWCSSCEHSDNSSNVCTLCNKDYAHCLTNNHEYYRFRWQKGILNMDNVQKYNEAEWEMRLGDIPVEPQIGVLDEVWKNVTVEILKMPSGEYSVGWYKQENSERLV